MIAERHYDDELLISFMESGGGASRDLHLASCRICSETLESFRMISGVLTDGAVWDLRDLPEENDAVPSTVAFLRSFADQMVDEDTMASKWMRDLLAGSRESWMPRLQRHPEYRTAGMVRALADAASRATDTIPAEAVAIAELATEIADRMDVSAYASDTVAKLRGAAWRERAYALFYVGRVPEAESAVAIAEGHYANCVVGEYDLARVHIVRAILDQTLDRIDQGLNTARESQSVFSSFEDTSKTATASETVAYLYMKSGRYNEAIEVLQELVRNAQPHSSVEPRWLANLGSCYRELAEPVPALDYLRLAAEAYEQLDVPIEAARTRWNVANVLLGEGRFVEAEPRLLELQRYFADVGMVVTAVLVGLDLVEILIAQERYAEVERTCRSAVERLANAGLAYSSRAMTAVAYIREAAANARATTKQVRAVREYIQRLPEQPRLLFAPPPFEP